MKLGFTAVAVAFSVLLSAATAAPFRPTQTTVATQLSYQSTSYEIGPGQMQIVQIPVKNRPVQMMVQSVSPYTQGLASVTIARAGGYHIYGIPGGGGETLEWVGVDLASNGVPSDPRINAGFSATRGAHIMYVNVPFGSSVDVQVHSLYAVQILNSDTQHTVAVVVTLMY